MASKPRSTKLRTKEDTLTSIDLFAGAGGITTGFMMSGIKSLYANEIEAEYASTLKKNHPEVYVDVADIRKVEPKEVMKHLGIKPGEISIVTGGPPCQGFSINAPTRTTDDQRNHLFRDFLRFVGAFKPSYVVIENVPGMVSFEGGGTVRAIQAALSSEGYKTDIKILFAPHYGVPQIRWRSIIVGTRLKIDPKLLLPQPTHYATGRANFTSKLQGRSLIFDPTALDTQKLSSPTSVWDAISDLPPIPNGGGEAISSYQHKPKSDFQKLMRGRAGNLVLNHQCAGISQVNIQRLEHIPPGGSWRDIPHDLLPLGMKRARRSDHTKRYGRLDPNGFCSTILTKCDPHWGSYFHPTQTRVLSVREAARIQSFPDAIEFLGSLTAQYKQVGNAVPPLFAKAIGDQIALINSLSSGELEKISTNWSDKQPQLFP